MYFVSKLRNHTQERVALPHHQGHNNTIYFKDRRRKAFTEPGLGDTHHRTRRLDPSALLCDRWSVNHRFCDMVLGRSYCTERSDILLLDLYNGWALLAIVAF